jgi:lipopolysaccharide export LptBFGC system permease protein LptF
MMSAAQLTYRLRRGSADKDLMRKWDAEIWQRIAMGLAPLAFGFLGAPLGLWSARGSRAAAFLMALVIALPVFYPFLRLGQNLAEAGVVPAPVALLLGDALLMCAGGFFLVRVVRT